MGLTGTGDLEARRHLEVSQRLRERRRMLGLTQKQVTSRLGRLGIASSNKSLSSLEHGAGLDVARLPELAAALDCTVTWLLGLTDDPHGWEPDPDAPCFSSARLTAPAAHPGHRAQDVEDAPPPAPQSAPQAQGAAPRPTSRPWILGPLPVEH